MDLDKSKESGGSERTELVVPAIEKLEKSVSSMRLWLKLVFAALLIVWLTCLLGPLFLPPLIATFL